MARPANKNRPIQPKDARIAKSRRKKSQSEMGDIDFDPADQPKPAHGMPATPIPDALARHADPDVLNRLWTIIESRKAADPEVSHSARLLARGTTRIAQKLGEEATECLIEVITGNRTGLIGESADLLYHLLVTWVHAGIRPEEVWRELQQRERVSLLSEGKEVPLKRLPGSVPLRTTKIP
jgi:phosphoribosyl-ATP pyrophosphohydrolase